MPLRTLILWSASILSAMLSPGCEQQSPIPAEDPASPTQPTGVSTLVSDDVMMLSFAPGEWTPSLVEEAARTIRETPHPPSEIVLEIGKETVSAESFRQLRQISGLTGLSLIYTRIDAPALTEMAGLNQLTSLHLQDVKLPGNYAEEFPRLKNLSSLKLSRQDHAEELLEISADHTQLSRLQLNFLELTEGLCEAIARHESLETLELLQTSTAPGLDATALSGLTSLKTLEVTVWNADWQLTDFSFLRDLAQLENVSLRTGALLEDRVSDSLSGLEHLQYVTLWDTEITNAGYRKLMSVVSLRDVTIRSSLIDDAGITSVPLPANLESLVLEHSRVTCAGAVATELPESLTSFSIEPALQQTALLKTASPQHQKLLTASARGDSNEGGLQVWDAKTGDLLMFGATWCAGSLITTTPDETQIIVNQGLVSSQNELIFLDTETGGLVRRLKIPVTDSAALVAVAHSARRFAVATSESLQLREIGNGEELFSLPLTAGRPLTLTFSPDDQYLAISYQHGSEVEIRDLTIEGKVIQAVEGSNLYFSPDSRFVSVTYPSNVYRIGDAKPLAWKSGRFISDKELLFLQSGNVKGYMLGLFDLEQQQQTHAVELIGDHLKSWIVSPAAELVAKVEAESIEVVEYRTGNVRCVIHAAAGMPDPPLVIITPSVFLGDRALVGSVSQAFAMCDVN